MFDWIWKRKRGGETLAFPDNTAAFAHACTLGYLPLIGGLVPALVEEEGEPGRDGEHTFLIRLAGGADGRSFWCCTLKEAPSRPKPGDLVGFRVVTIASDLPEYASLIGYVACRLEPSFVVGKGWPVAQNYTPQNIKQAIHF